MPIKLKIKKLHPEAVLPTQAKANDSGYDITAIDDGIFNQDGTYIEYKTGISVELPEGYHCEMFPRSSVTKTDLVLGNSIGNIDPGFRGEITCRFKYIPRIHPYLDFEGRTSDELIQDPILYKKGDRIAQLIIRKTLEADIEEVEQLSQTERGDGAYGHSGN